VAPSSVFEGVVGRDLDHDIRLDSDNVDVLPVPVADVVAADDRRPRVIVASGDELGGQQRLLDGGEKARARSTRTVDRVRSTWRRHSAVSSL
jgi:hypothetical protein